jgi:hypothetical protein
MRDIDTIDSELRLLVAIRHLVREVEGPDTEHHVHRRAAG